MIFFQSMSKFLMPKRFQIKAMKNLILTFLFLAGLAPAEQFTLLIYETKSDFAARTDPAKAAKYWDAYGKLGAELQQAGVLRGGSALQAGDTAKTVTVRNGSGAARNGAYANSPNSLSGFFLIEVPNLAAAIAWAEKFPAASSAAVEVRPTVPNPSMKSAPTSQE